MPLNKDVALALAKGLGRSKNKPVSTDLLCPERCGGTLVYPEMVIHLDPPRRRTLCPKCSYKGWEAMKEGENVEPQT